MLRPVQRAGNRRYYRPEDVALVQRIDRLLNKEGYTIVGAQQVLANYPQPPAEPEVNIVPALRAIRALLADAVEEDVQP